MSKETFAIINDQDQVVNHILVDKDAPDFEQVMADQLAHWGCVRYVETEPNTVIILDESPTIWTTHKEDTGFVLPEIFTDLEIKPAPFDPATLDHETVVIKGRRYPADSLLIKENAATRPAGWVLPEGETEVSLSDAE